MNKIIFITPILFLISFSLVNPKSWKESYKCLDSSIIHNNNICYYSGGKSDIIYLKGCSTGYECTFEVEKRKSIYMRACQPKTWKLEYKKEEGSSCLLDGECLTNYCKDKKCTFKKIGEECTDDLDCEKDAYCNNGHCKACAKEGEDCEYNDGCLAGYYCGQKEPYATKTCVAKYSIPNGNYASDEILCESGKRDYDTNICYDTESLVLEGTSCIDNSSCKGIKIIGTEKFNTTLSCECTWDNKTICDYGTKSERWTSFVSYYKTEMPKKQVSYFRGKEESGLIL